MSLTSDASNWQQAYRLAESLPFHFTWPAKRRAISEFLLALRQALIAGRAE
ncbi:hypothetical protein ACLIKD_06740 [Azonexus sp. IMCC34842]|uniref:hypothetical protein n=1 Tax=Azonexus sp. IMCC34842 TaxID=3420950 RepID=UPI003D0D473B